MDSERSLSQRKKEEAARWLLLSDEGDMSTGGAADLEAWLSDSRNRDLFDASEAAWKNSALFADTPEIMQMRKDALRSLVDRQSTGENATSEVTGIEHANAQPSPLSERFTAVWKPLMALAASVALFFVFLSVWQRPVEYSTEPGHLLTVTLEDGSVVDLDSSSRLTANLDDSKRQITLMEGRANFKVAKDSQRPFTVIAGDKVFVAKGTEFSVELVNNDVRAMLYEGKVVVVSADPTHTTATAKSKGGQLAAPSGVTMNPGDAFVAARIGALAQARIEKPANPEMMDDWREGRLGFVNEPLALAVARMNRHSAVKIKLDLKADRAIMVSGTFQAGQTEAFVEGVAKLNKLSVHRDGSVIVLSN